MIVYEFTEAEQKEMNAIENKYEKLLSDISNEIERTKPAIDLETFSAGRTASVELYEEWEATGSAEWREARNKEMETINEFNDKRGEFYKKCCLRQFKELGGKPANILADVKKQVETAIYNRYMWIVSNLKEQWDGMTGLQDFDAIFMQKKGNTYFVGGEFLLSERKDFLSLHYAFFGDSDIAIKKIDEIVLETVTNSPYTDIGEGKRGFTIDDIAPPKKKKHKFNPNDDLLKARYRTSIYSPPISDMALMIQKAAEYDYKLNPLTAYAEAGSTQLTLWDILPPKQGDALSAIKELSVSTHKVLSIAITELAKVNHTGDGKREFKTGRVYIPLAEYAVRCGYDVIEHPKDTPEETEREKRRVKITMDNFRKKLNKDLKLLQHAEFEWEEKKRGKVIEFDNVKLCGRVAVRSGTILIEFSETMARAIIANPLTQYPLELLKLDERSANAYKIGVKLSEHYAIDANARKGTNTLLKVSTLLGYTTLSTDIEYIKHYGYDRIKEQFENALDNLVTADVIDDWAYTGKNGKPLNDEEATNLSYNDWLNLNVKYTMPLYPDQSARLERKAERGKEKAEKKKKTPAARRPKEPAAKQTATKRKKTEKM